MCILIYYMNAIIIYFIIHHFQQYFRYIPSEYPNTQHQIFLSGISSLVYPIYYLFRKHVKHYNIRTGES